MIMESVLRQKLQAEDGIFMGKPHGKLQKLYAENEKDKIALMHDPYAVAWKINSKQKIIAETVGHIPKELSKAAWEGGRSLVLFVKKSIFLLQYRKEV